MNLVYLFMLNLIENLDFNAPVQEAAKAVALPTEYIIPAIILIIVTIFIFFFLKKIIVNSILGIIVLLGANFIFQLNLPWIPSIVVSIIFGPAGVGVMIILRIFGVPL